MTRARVGVVAFGICTLSFVPAIREAVRIPDLTVHVPKAPLALAGGTGRVEGLLDPARLRGRTSLDVDGEPLGTAVGETGRFGLDVPRRGQGLHLLRWNVRYGDVWDRSVGLAYVEGPFGASGEVPCGIQVIISQRLLDDGDVAGGEDLATRFADQALRLLNERLDAIGFPEAGGATIRLRVVSEGLSVRARFDFGGGGSFQTTTTVGFEPSGRTLRPRLIADVAFDPDDRFRALLRSRGFAEGAQRGFLLGLLFPPAILLTTAVGGSLGESEAEDRARDQVRAAVIDFCVTKGMA